ncbi:protein FAM184A-like isoform X1 [Bolinopsis microptera]|uniref:protein FAM184A-like isoform X1 n=1 Tax=Bolinopsis microptera TaxID=2820187 RepID=UPI00307A388A
MNANQNGLDGPMTPELHLKMSKKIAQLTKVVYALNTKNDEHDAHISCLQEAHELELKKVLASAEEQIVKLQTVVANQRNDKEAILDLRNRIFEYDQTNQDAVNEFKKFKVHTQDREDTLKKAYEEQMRTLKYELENMKSEFQSKTAEFAERSNQHDASSIMLKSLKEKHENELELLKEVAEQQQAAHEKKMDDLMKNYDKEISALKQKHREELASQVSTEKSSLSTLYKTQIAQLEEEVSTLKQLMEQGEYQSNNRISILTKEVEAAEARKANHAAEKEALGKENERLKSEVDELEGKFMETRRDLDNALQELANVKNDLSAQETAARRFADESNKKAGKIGELDELSQLHSVENEKLKFELKKLNDKLLEKEDEFGRLKEKHAKTIGIWEDKSNQLKKDINVKDEEISRLKAEYKLSMEEHLASSSEREVELQKQKLEEIRLVKESSEKELEEVLEVSRANSQAIRDALEAEAANEKQALIEGYEVQLAELRKERDEMLTQLHELSDEVVRLKSVMGNSESALGETEKERQQLLHSLNEKQQHLELLHNELKDKLSVLQSLREEFDKEVANHAVTKKQREQYADDKVAAKAKELDGYWSKKLREDLEALEHELLRRQSQSRSSEIKRMKDTHLQEFLDAEAAWKEKTEALQAKVKELEKQLSVLNVEALKKEMSLNEQSKSEYLELNAKIKQLKIDHAQNIKEIEEEHKDAMKRLDESLTRDFKNQEDKLVLAHRQNIHEMTKANKLSVDVLKDQFEQKRTLDINTLKMTARKELENQLTKCKKECAEKTELRIHELSLGYEEQKEELQRELEMRDREMKQFNIKLEQVQNQLTDKQLELSQYKDDVEELQNNLADLQKEFEEKCKEVMQIKQEAVIQIKKREKKLNAIHLSEIKGVQQKFTRDVDELTFKHQNDVEDLRLQMSELNHQLSLAYEQYSNRPSRPEDLNKILELENTIAEADERIRHLIDEKKFFELELVNRESNYNRVFNTAGPKIGLINPMNVKTRITKKSRSDTAMRNPSSMTHQSTKSPNVATAFSSPILPNAPNTNNRSKPQLIPISSRTSSIESLVTQTITTSSGGRPVVGTTRRVVKNAFVDKKSDAVVPPT